MRKLALILWGFLCLPTIAFAQSPTGIWYLNSNNGRTTAGTVNPFPVTCISGCSGGGGGDATAANQALQITQETAINTVLGTTADAAATAGGTGTEAAKLRLMTTQLATIATNTGISTATAANQALQITQETAINTVLGTTASAAATAGSVGDVSAKLRLMTTQLDSILTAIGSAIPAGTNTIGNVQGAPNVTPTNCSGTIAVAATAQNAFTAGATKHGFTIQNLSTDTMTISFTTTADVPGTAGSYTLNPSATGVAGGSYSTPFGFGMNTALSVLAATMGSAYSCTWW